MRSFFLRNSDFLLIVKPPGGQVYCLPDKTLEKVENVRRSFFKKSEKVRV
jgi:hypothetical protein